MPEPKVKVIRSKKRVTSDKNVYELAKERIHTAYDMFDSVSVSFSGGKDSTAVLQMVYEVAQERDDLPLHVFFFDEEAIPYQTEEYVRRVANWPGIDLDWYCLPVQHRNACSRKSIYWYPYDPDCEEKWVRPLPPEAITELEGFPIQPPEARLTIPHTDALLFDPQKHGNVAMFMGIRAQESMTRQRAVTQKVKENYIIKYNEPTDKGNLWRVYPIYDWRTEDVWTAPSKFGWDYNKAYDVMEMAGLAQSQQRCSPAYGEEPLQKLWTYQHCFPEIWDKMTDRVPGAAAAARYATTELYGFKKRPEKPPTMSWEGYIAHLIDQWPKTDQKRYVAERVGSELQKHFKKTSDPLAVKAPHPVSGVSWDYITQIAMRGDFKTRRSPMARINPSEMDRHWKQYNDEIQDMLSKGQL